MKYAFYGFLCGTGITLVCLILIFLALGAVGVSSPMIPVIAGLFIPLGTATGSKLSPEGAARPLYMPMAAFTAGSAVIIALNIAYSPRSFYLGLAVMSAVVCGIFYYTLRPLTRESGGGINVKKNLLYGLSLSVATALLTWNWVVLICGVLLNAAGAFFLRLKLKPEEPKHLKEISVSLNDSAKEEEPAAPKKSSRYPLAMAASFAVFAVGGYFLYPWAKSVIIFMLFLGAAAALAAAFGMAVKRS